MPCCHQKLHHHTTLLKSIKYIYTLPHIHVYVYIYIYSNEIRDLTAELLTQVCHNVCLEPSLQKLDNEHFQRRTANTDDNARLDISADGFWERSERAFFDVRVFNPFAPTNLKHQLGSCYHLHEMEKRRQSNEEALHLWSLPHLEAWASKQLFFTNALPPCSH